MVRRSQDCSWLLQLRCSVQCHISSSCCVWTVCNLALLKSTSNLLSTPQIWCLIGVYALILSFGCYFIMNYLMFAQFIEELRTYAGVAPFERLENYMTDKIKDRWVGLSWLRSKRRSVLKLRGLNLIACAGYVFISLIVLVATVYLPVLVN
jgi:hypothetical protein